MRRTIIDLTLDDEKTDSRSEVERLQDHIASLLAQVGGLQNELLDTKAELEHTRVDLKYAKEKLKNSVGTPLTQDTNMLKRPRSVTPMGKPKRTTVKEDSIIADTPSPLIKPKLESHSVPTMTESRIKIEERSPDKEIDLFSEAPISSSPSPSDSGHVAKRRRLDAVEQITRGSKNPHEAFKATTSRKVHNRDAVRLEEGGQANRTTTNLPSAADLTVIKPSPINLPVPRAMLLARYGGASRSLIQKVKQDRNPTSSTKCRELIFPDFKHNPDLPLEPGASGFIYASREDVQGHSFSLFIRYTRSQKAVWRYLGEYKTEKSGTMSSEHFNSLPDKVQSAWAKRIRTAKSKPSREYVAMRVRIALRKTGVIPSEKDLEAFVKKEIKRPKTNCQKEMKRPKRNQKTKKTKNPEDVKAEEDILEAMRQGQEHIDIVSVTCTSYDHVFAEDIRRTFASMSIQPTPKRFVHPQSSSVLATTNTTSKKTKGPKASTSSNQGIADPSQRGTKNQDKDFIEGDNRSSTGMPVSTLNLQLRPRKLVSRAFRAEESSSDSGEEDSWNTEELDSEYENSDSDDEWEWE